MYLYVDFNPFVLKEAPRDLGSEDELKEWVWLHHKEKILQSMSFQQQCRESEYERALKRLRLLDVISKVQRQFLQSESSLVVFGSLLEGILELMDSEYGFIGEIKFEGENNEIVYLHSHAITNIAWNTATQKFYEVHCASGLRFYNLDTLFGTVITTKEPVISNDPKTDSRAGGLPKGHPPLNHFLGIPFFKSTSNGNVMNGMVGIANKPGGYTQKDIEFLEPFTVTCSNLIQAYLQIEKNKELINTLELKVKERTRELQDLNANLEDANRKVVKASKAQLEHFACMSHEIRTPLNCIIGLSSLLQETELNPMQEESMRMIISSGDLLLTVVNDVLDYSKLETGNVDIDIQRSNLQETLNAIIHSIEMKALSKKLTLRTFYDSNVPEYVHTDSRRLQQILYNLLGNAIKFSGEDNFVDLTVIIHDLALDTNLTNGYNPRQHPDGLLEDDQNRSLCPFHRPTGKASTKASPSAPVLRFIIKDYGKGIERKDFNRIFKPFLQASAETERVYGGTGLGLAITAKLVHGLGGEIFVESEEGQWSEFTVDLPFMEPVVDFRGISDQLQNVTVCVVEPDLPSQKLSLRIFKQFDVRCIGFTHMNDLHSSFSHKDEVQTENTTYVCLIQEEAYDDLLYKQLSRCWHPLLLSFGPKYLVPTTQGHFRSLTHVLPSVLMKSILKVVQSFKEPKLLMPQPSLSANVVPYQELRVLIAEDNLINQKVLVRMLKRLGIRTIDVVDDGLKAVERDKATCYDIVLMDMQMPVMDGIESCRRIRGRQGGHPKPKVVFVTAHVGNSFEAECAKAGAAGFLPKPFNIREIEKCFQRLHAAGRHAEDEFLDSLTMIQSPLPIPPSHRQTGASIA